MNKMIDPRDCRNFRKGKICSNHNQDLLAYLDNRVISDINLTFEPEMFDKAFEYCASCAHFLPFNPMHDPGQAIH